MRDVRWVKSVGIPEGEPTVAWSALLEFDLSFRKEALERANEERISIKAAFDQLRAAPDTISKLLLQPAQMSMLTDSGACLLG